MTDESEPKPAKRSRTMSIAIGLAAVALILVLIVAAFVGWQWYAGNASLEGLLADLKSQGLPTSAAELNKFYVIPDEAEDTTYLWVAAIDGVTNANVSRKGQDLPFIGQGETPVPSPGDEWAELEACRALVDDLEAELQTVYEAAESEGYVRYPVNFSAGTAVTLTHAQSARDVARLLLLDAHVAAHDGEYARVLKDLQAIFALSDTLQREPILLSQLVRIAIHGIGCDALQDLMPYCQWSDADLASLQSAIESADFKSGIIDGLNGERAISLTEIGRMPIGPFGPTNKRAALEFFASTQEVLIEPWYDALNQEGDLNEEFMIRGQGQLSRLRFVAVLMLMPAVEQAMIAGARATAEQRCAIAAIAVRRYWLQHEEWPASLEEIDAVLFGSGFDSAAGLVDPFDGQALRLKADELAMIIYSIGGDREDDGGNCAEVYGSLPTDVGFVLKLTD